MPQYGRAEALPSLGMAPWDKGHLIPLCSTYLSWLSLFLLFLLLRAILVLELFFRAGPILMEVFSRAVVLRATLFPL